MNPWSQRVSGRLLSGTTVRTTCRGTNGRVYAFAHDVYGQWTGRGWLVSDTVGVDPPEEPDAPDEPVIVRALDQQGTLPDRLCAYMRSRSSGRDEPQDPTLGFTMCLLPCVLPPVCRMTPYYRAKETRVWERGDSEYVSQPVIVYHVTSVPRTVQDLVDQTLEYPDVDDVVLTRSGMIMDTRGVQYSDTDVDCVVIQVVRSQLAHSGSGVEDVHVLPSLRLHLRGRTFRLVSVACKTGSAGGGHWVAYANTIAGWFLLNDLCVTPVPSMDHVMNGVLFLYEDVEIPLFDHLPTGLTNSGVCCWANTFAQMVRYSPSVANAIGITGRISSFVELGHLLIL